jgi:hypothetical protein
LGLDRTKSIVIIAAFNKSSALKGRYCIVGVGSGSTERLRVSILG